MAMGREPGGGVVRFSLAAVHHHTGNLGGDAKKAEEKGLDKDLPVRRSL